MTRDHGKKTFVRRAWISTRNFLTELHQVFNLQVQVQVHSFRCIFRSPVPMQIVVAAMLLTKTKISSMTLQWHLSMQSIKITNRLQVNYFRSRNRYSAEKQGLTTVCHPQMLCAVAWRTRHDKTFVHSFTNLHIQTKFVVNKYSEPKYKYGYEYKYFKFVLKYKYKYQVLQLWM